jgi:hypothetical protein
VVVVGDKVLGEEVSGTLVGAGTPLAIMANNKLLTFHLPEPHLEGR